MISLDEMNRCIAQFGAAQKAFMRQEKRAALRSILFDVPRRSSLGWHCYYQAAGPLLRELTARLTPEEAGRRMKRLCSRPYYLTLSILMCSFFGARQQRLLDAGVRFGDALPSEGASQIDDALLLVDFWKRACQTYRNDGSLLPSLAGYTQPILTPQTVHELDARLTPSTPELRHLLRRLAATLELYSFILHGEQRDGIFAHGPYPLPGGAQLVVHEFTDLQNDFLPWAQTASRNLYPNLAIALRLKDVQTRFDLFGGVLCEPREIAPVAEGLFTRAEEGTVRAVPFEKVPEIQQHAADAQNELYLKAAEWTPRYKAEYGVHLFANHLREFFRLAGMGAEWDEIIRSRFQAAAEAGLEPMLDRSEPPSIWPFMAATDGDFFWPVVPHQTALKKVSIG